MADAKKTVLAILGALFLILIIFVVAAVGGMTYFVRSHVNSREASSESASEEFTKTRQRFAGQHPMIERRAEASDDDFDRFVLHRPEPTAERVQLEALRALAYDRDRQRLLHLSVPFWLLRLAPSGNGFSMFGQSNIDVGRAHVTVEDLERHGPGLILDAHDRRGSEVLVWVE